MNDELQRIWKEVVATEYSYHSGINLEGQRKTTINLSHDSRCSGLDYLYIICSVRTLIKLEPM
jgi:hypothetical protein